MHVDRLTAIGGHLDPIATLLEQPHGDELVDDVVLRDENARCGSGDRVLRGFSGSAVR